MELSPEQRYLEDTYGYEFDKSTLVDIGGGIWFAKVRTTHHTEHGKPEETLYILASSLHRFVMLEKEAVKLAVALNRCL